MFIHIIQCCIISSLEQDLTFEYRINICCYVQFKVYPLLTPGCVSLGHSPDGEETLESLVFFEFAVRKLNYIKENQSQTEVKGIKTNFIPELIHRERETSVVIHWAGLGTRVFPQIIMENSSEFLANPVQQRQVGI